MSDASVLPAYSMNLASFPQMYERALVQPLFRPWAEALLDRAALSPNACVLDVACGTGIVARLARQRVGPESAVVGVDISAPMLAVARAIEPSVSWREGSASALPVDEGERFDVVSCQQGLQFFDAREAAVREMRRVLAPSGVALVATWRSVEEMPLMRDLKAVAERHVGAIDDRRHAFPDDAALQRLLATAGFADVEVEVLSLPMHFVDGAQFIRMNAMALVGMSAATADAAERERLADVIGKDSAAAARPYMQGAALTFDMSANIAKAR